MTLVYKRSLEVRWSDRKQTHPQSFHKFQRVWAIPKDNPSLESAILHSTAFYIQGYLINDVIITCTRIPDNSKRIIDLYPNTNTSPVSVGFTPNSTIPTEEQGLCFTPKEKQFCTWPHELWDHEVLLYWDKSVSPGTSDNHFSCHFWGSTSKGLVARRGLKCC